MVGEHNLEISFSIEWGYFYFRFEKNEERRMSETYPRVWPWRIMLRFRNVLSTNRSWRRRLKKRE